MSSDFQLWTNDGTPQNRRFPDALDPDFFKIDDRRALDYLRILAAMAEKLRLDETGSWRVLLPDAPSPNENGLRDWQPILAKVESRRDNPPHLALFVTFLRLYRHAQDHLNSLTKAHLDHYYREVLGFRPRPAKPDHLSAFPSLAKGVTQHLLPVGTALDAGQDADGNPLIYLTESEIVVTPARVSSVKAMRVTSGTPWLRVAPIADSKDGLGAPFAKDELPRWPALGPADTAGPTSQDHLGFGVAISSPLLFLKEGRRTIQLTVGVPGVDWTKWKAYVSAAGKWLPVTDISGDSTLVTITIDPKDPAIVGTDPKVHPEAPPTDWPVLKLYAPADLSNDDYKRSMAAPITNLAVRVDRVTSLKLSNDFGPLDATHPFQPFGPRPVVGSAFSFESEELKAKTIKSWTPLFEWQGKPDPDQLTDYTSTDFGANKRTVKDASFTFSCPSSENPSMDRSLFSPAEIMGPLSAIQLKAPPAAFGHSQYPVRVSDVATQNAAAIVGNKPTTPFPPEPYTPTLKSFNLGYISEQSITEQSIRAADLRIFHLHPFGIKRLNSSAPLLPTCPDASSLYIGLADCDPGSLVHLHFAAIEGSGTSILAPPPISWSYLSDKGWAEFESGPVEDGTNGLMQPGITSFEAMPGAVNNNPLMPVGLHWLRVRVTGDPDAVCKLSGITAQAVRATLQLSDAVPVHLRAGSRDVLPAGSLKNLLAPDPAIASVAQPFTSYGGREAEGEKGFYTRVSERLRHRQRAITAWDYERLVLSKFPEIYKVLCVRSGPGEVKVVVVPRSVRASWYDRLQPRPAPALKIEIEEYLQNLSSGMARVSVIDPDYEPLQVICAVTFVKGKSPAVCKSQLVEDLKRFLTPWAYDDSKEIVFGGRIHQSVIQAFIDGRDYIEHFTGFQLIQNPSVATEQMAKDLPVTEAKATNPWSILVSAREHLVHT